MSALNPKRIKSIPSGEEILRNMEETIRKIGAETYVLRLYVSGTTPRSVLAITNIKRICDEYLRGRCDLEVVDIYQQPAVAKSEQIIAAPTLIKKHPLPLRKFIGDLNDQEKVLLGLDLKTAAVR